MGAEFILAGNDAVRALAQELGLGLWDKGMRYGDREPQGGIGTTAAGLADAVRAADRAIARPSTAAVGARAARLARDRARRPRGDRRAEIVAVRRGIPATDLAGLAHIDTEPAPSVAGGNQGLALGLAARLGEVRLATRPRWWNGGPAGCGSRPPAGMRASPTQRSRPCARVIERIEFVPPLPVGKRDAFAGSATGMRRSCSSPCASRHRSAR